MTPVKAIRAKCLDCCCGNSAEVRRCPCVDCTLYPFRLGKNPNYKQLSNEASYNAALNLNLNAVTTR